MRACGPRALALKAYLDRLRQRDERTWGWLWLGVLLWAFGVVKIAATTFFYSPLMDGGFYLNVASHVRDGDGLVSDICLFQEGCPYLPHATGTYPLWPWLLGHVARVVPLTYAGRWLATAFYFLSLFLGYAWAASFSPKAVFGKVLPGFHGGHVFVLMLGINTELFRYTSAPYTEGLSCALFFATLLRLDPLVRRANWRAGVELGVWFSLATLTRYQNALLPFCILPVLTISSIVVRGRRLALAQVTAIAAGVFALTMALHYRRLAGFVTNLDLGIMLRWDQMRFSDVIGDIPTIQTAPNLGAYLVDRASGFAVAFGAGPKSYWNQFHVLQYALLIALPAAAVQGLRRARQHGWAPLSAWFRDANNLPAACTWTVALGYFFSIHSLHMNGTVINEWVFAARQAMFSVVLIFFALLYLLRHRWAPLRGVALILLCASLYWGGRGLDDIIAPIFGQAPPPAPPLATWLNEQRSARPSLTVAYRWPQSLTQYTHGVGYYWYYYGTPLQDVEAMVSQLGADFLIVPENQRFVFRADPKFRSLFVLHERVDRFEIYTLRGNPRPSPL